MSRCGKVPLITLRKRCGAIRLSGDYQFLNNMTELDPYCLARTEELLHKLARAAQIGHGQKVFIK